jgi:methylase of polypeptide subunit release factors
MARSRHVDPLAELAAVLADRGYTEAGLERAFGGLEGSAVEALRDVLAPEDERLGTLVELFTFGAPVGEQAAEAALAPVPLAALADEGLIEQSDAKVVTPLRVTPWAGLQLVHDAWGPGPLAADYVAGVNEAAELLARLTVRREVETALDLGTGCGLQALLVARHARRVVGVDVNPRAIELASINARINRAASIEWRRGNWFEPVRGELFDLVVANPPYVVSPDADLLFRDSGLEPGELCASLLAELPAHLAPGGFACVLCNWPLRTGDERWDVPRDWTRAGGCDTLLLDFGPEPVADYAARWTEPPATPDAAAYARAVERWLRYYAGLGIESISFGALILRRAKTGRGWFRGLDVLSDPNASTSEQLLRIFDAQDFLARAGDDRILDSVFRPISASRLTHVLSYGDSGYELESARLSLARGIGLKGAVSPLAVHVLLRLDGRRPLRALVSDVARERALDHDLLRSEALAAVVRLYERGLLARSPAD